MRSVTPVVARSLPLLLAAGATVSSATTPASAATAAVKPAAAILASTTVPGARDSLTPAQRLAAVQSAKQINYYPAGGSWTRMWTDFDAKKIDADLAKARALGADSVRAIVFPSAFGYPTPKPEYAAKLAQFVSLAAARGMTVKVTLFDWWDGYSDVAGSTTWANALLAPFRNDDRIISIELQNELDPTDPAAIGWAKKLLPVIRKAVPGVPVTIPISSSAGVAGLSTLKSAMAATPLDYYDFHLYGNSERALASIRQAQAAVAPAPLVIGETGTNTLQSSEGEQAAYLARVFAAAEVAGVNAVAPWTLNDFAAGSIPDSGVARIPEQYWYGLYRADSTAKPAAAVAKAEWNGAPSPTGLMDLGFENAAGQTPWRSYLSDLGTPTRTQTAARSGKWSVMLTNTGKTAAGSPSYRVSPIEPVQPGRRWHAEVWVRGKNETGSTQIALSWFDVNDRWIGGASSADLPSGTTDWTRLSVDGVAPAGAASLQVHLKSGADTGTVWFDDVAISAS
ncbi:glycosyl hydrolase [Actinoplanes sp. SE50]|uniref:cellulase family glycosylhydrolase n=1 Tax=unclassified Actinoplanes TaxID=2626549 RepID=UPI00023ECAD1|nr:MULTISPECIES: cellulase family glycosylhydrolase [unclassified Actinoplanes]AEV83172.1 Endoglucanase [Actinoplanes sp. SE50/110]ATO81565.1 glycosyl hydrolase [Actinoplanes sp. SE50]SLL98973.1 glycosyl hydrolase [Actinoplanes sp. SE50/110]